MTSRYRARVGINRVRLPSLNNTSSFNASLKVPKMFVTVILLIMVTSPSEIRASELLEQRTRVVVKSFVMMIDQALRALDAISKQ